MEIIAEMGVNWKFREQAIYMMGRAFVLGIKHVKFQMWKPEQIPEKLKELRSMYVDEKLATELFEVGKQYGQEVFFSVFYPEAVEICEKIGVNFYKVRFDDRNDYQLYKRLKKTNKTIFVSCQDPKDTAYFNLTTYQKRVKFLYCVPRYPAKLGDYSFSIRYDHNKKFQGISDHTSDLMLLKMSIYHPISKYDWFELHVKLNDDCFEHAWSKSFDQLTEVLKP